MTRMRPWWRDAEFSWNTPARLAFGPPAALGVVDSVTTRPGAFGSGKPGPNVAAGGRFSPGWYPWEADSSLLPVAFWASALRSTVKSPPAPAMSPGRGLVTTSLIAGLEPEFWAWPATVAKAVGAPPSTKTPPPLNPPPPPAHPRP